MSRRRQFPNAFNPFLPFGVGFDAARLAMEAQTVIGLRMMKLAAGGPAAQAEATRMVSEKSAAFVEAQMDILTSLMTGRDATPARTMALYRRKVRANRKRLTR